MKNTEKNKKREWRLWYNIDDQKNENLNPVVVRMVKFQATTYEDMLKKALKILKRSAKRVRRPKSCYSVNIFPGPFPEEEAIDGREIFRLKEKYSDTQKILKLKEEDVQKYFVQGTGPKAFEQL